MLNFRKLDQGKLEFVAVATVDELPPDARLVVDVDDRRIALFNVGGTIYAIADVCSHDDGPVGEGPLDGLQIECPRHGARFDLPSGKALTLPAVVDIPAYPVRIVGPQVEIGLPTD